MESSNQNCLKIQSKENQIVEFDKKILKLSPYLDRIQNKNEIIPLETLDFNSLCFLKKFLEAHHYDKDSMSWTFPFTSNILKEHVDSTSYEIFKDYCASGQPKEKLIECAKKLAPIIEVGFFLDINPFKKIANVALQIPLYCGTSDEDIKQFKEKWGITEEDITPDKQRKIMEENKPIFDAIKERFQKKLEELQKKAQEECKKD